MTSIYQWFSEPLSYPFMQNALFTALIVAVICALLSCYLVLKGWSLMGDAISHAVLPGIIGAYWLGIPLAIGAFTAGVFCSVSVGYLKEHSRIKEDTVMGIVFSGMFALGLVMFVKTDGSQHLMHILFGNLLGISNQEMWQTIILSLVVFTIISLKRRDFLLYCFDANHARIAGLPVKLLHYGLLMLLALTIVGAMQVVGVILVVAMLISPGITAYLLTKRFDYMILIALATSLLSTCMGTLVSYHIDAATGPCIILLQAIMFVLALIWVKLKPYSK